MDLEARITCAAAERAGKYVPPAIVPFLNPEALWEGTSVGQLAAECRARNERSAEILAAAERRATEEVQASRQINPDFEVRCGKCGAAGSTKITEVSKQKRSADEGESVFYWCKVCNAKWMRA